MKKEYYECVGGRDISVLISHLRVAKIKNMLKDFTAKIFAEIRCLQKLWHKFVRVIKCLAIYPVHILLCFIINLKPKTNKKRGEGQGMVIVPA